ncbi:uncharacterized protein UTRI_01779_B [Ustilago trichophora]|uniref:RNA polymerase II-associated protein 3 n=1 Tax=Ustilago trichophora TaxID=86804 RepID=A0A5C3E250_9BASI|nr:uncharacterized protein UTRI_01779_B [Ustilago trichophora]
MDTQYPPDKIKAQAAKQQGNEAFGNKQYAEAIGFYSAAHIADPTEPTYPLNRAMAYIKLDKFVDAERDCTTALSLSPNNVKALYRRATAKVGADELESAIGDYEAVLRLDTGNAEAKAGLAKARQALESQKPRRTDPIDLGKLSKASNTAEGSNAQVGVPKWKQDTPANGSSSSVEAARKFLQQVGMSDTDEEDKMAASSKPSTSALPAKFPGETGGFLREVTTRKTTFKPTSQPVSLSSVPSDKTSTEQTSPKSTSASAQPTVKPATSTTAKKTASALNFGASSSPALAPAPTPQARTQTRTFPGKMSAIEFHRRWKSKSDRLELLSSIDPDSIPSMIDTMLEPELVAEILQTLAKGQRVSSEDEDLTKLTTGVLEALPRCKRFGMAVSMLDATEKGDAAFCIDAVGRQELRSIWEV